MATTISFKKPAASAAAAQTPTAGVAIGSAGTATLGDAKPNTSVLPPPPAEPVGATPGDVPSAALAAPAENQLHVASTGGLGGFEGEFTSRDMATPYLALFGKTSRGFEEHPDWLGQWVYDKTLPLGKTLRVVFLRCVKWWKEDLPFGADVVPQRFRTLAEARAAGFSEGQLKESAELDLLIEVDADAEGAADLAHVIEGDKAYVLARYGVQSTAYGRTVGVLTKDATGWLKKSLINGVYSMESQLKTSPKGTYFVPLLKVAGPTSEALRAKIQASLGGV